MFAFYFDAGHGWLLIPAATLAEFNFTARDFTKYSTIRTDGALFLEEDCDAGKFIAAYKAKHGREPQIKEVDCGRTSVARSYPRNAAGEWSPFAR